MAGKEILPNGKAVYTFDDGTVFYETGNTLGELIPDCYYLAIGNSHVFPGGRNGIRFKWYYCPQIVEDERFEYICKAFHETGGVEHVCRVKIISNENYQLVLQWLHNDAIETHHYQPGHGGITATAEQLN